MQALTDFAKERFVTKRVPLAEPFDRQRVCQTSSYHPTPRGSTPGVCPFEAPFRHFSHPEPLLSASLDRGRELATRAFQTLVSAARLLFFAPKLSRAEPPNRDQQLPRCHDRSPPEMADNGRFCHVREAFVRAVTNQSDRRIIDISVFELNDYVLDHRAAGPPGLVMDG